MKLKRETHICACTTSGQQLFPSYPLIFACEGNTRTLQNMWEVQVTLDLKKVTLCLCASDSLSKKQRSNNCSLPLV